MAKTPPPYTPVAQEDITCTEDLTPPGDKPRRSATPECNYDISSLLTGLTVHLDFSLAFFIISLGIFTSTFYASTHLETIRK